MTRVCTILYSNILSLVRSEGSLLFSSSFSIGACESAYDSDPPPLSSGFQMVMPTLPALPTEVHHLIISQSEKFYSLLLVSKAFHCEAERRLYRSLDLERYSTEMIQFYT